MEGEDRDQREPPPRPRTPPRPRGFRKDRALSVINYSVQSTVGGNGRLPLQRGPPRAKQLVLAHIREERAQAGEQQRQEESRRRGGRGGRCRSVDDDSAAVVAQTRQAAATAAAGSVGAETSSAMNERGNEEKEKTRDEGAGASCAPDGDDNFQDELDAIDEVARLYGDFSQVSDAELDLFDEL